jgi:YD repeat-containing protein
MPDGTTWYKYMIRDDVGRITSAIEKWEDSGNTYYRTNRYVYSTDGFDLLEHCRTHGADELRIGAWGYSNHRPSYFTNALGEVTTYSFDGTSHLLTSLTTPAGLVSIYTYGADGYLNHVIESISGTPLRTNGWSWSNAQLATTTNALGLKLSYTWDSINRLTQISFPDSTTIQSWYTNGSGNKILGRGKTIDRLGKSSYFAYNNMRRLTDIQDALGHITHFDYCTCGAVDYLKRAYGTGVEQVTHNIYDYRGNTLQTYFPGSVAVTNYYDTLRRLTKRTDFLSTNTYTYDNLNRLLTITNAVFGQVRKLTWNPEGTIATSVDENGVSISNTYDNLDRLRTRTYPDSGVEAFGYTANYAGPAVTQIRFPKSRLGLTMPLNGKQQKLLWAS